MSTLQRKTAGTGVAQYTEENISEVQTTCFAFSGGHGTVDVTFLIGNFLWILGLFSRTGS